jgi:hypothetical protein
MSKSPPPPPSNSAERGRTGSCPRGAASKATEVWYQLVEGPLSAWEPVGDEDSVRLQLSNPTVKDLKNAVQSSRPQAGAVPAADIAVYGRNDVQVRARDPIQDLSYTYTIQIPQPFVDYDGISEDGQYTDVQHHALERDSADGGDTDDEEDVFIGGNGNTIPVTYESPPKRTTNTRESLVMKKAINASDYDESAEEYTRRAAAKELAILMELAKSMRFLRLCSTYRATSGLIAVPPNKAIEYQRVRYLDCGLHHRCR